MRRALALLLLVAAVPAAAAAPSGASWRRAGLGAVSQPAPVAGRLAVYAVQAGALRVVALNAADGSTAWDVPASPSSVTAGVPAELAVAGGDVVYLEPVAGVLGSARVVARDVATGRLAWHGGAGAFTTWPEICPDAPGEVCVNGTLAAGAFGQLRYLASSGRLAGAVAMGTPVDPARELGLGLFDTGSRAPETLLAVSGGRVAWLRRLSTIFTIPRSSTDGGWNFDRFPAAGVFVGSVGVRPTVVNGTGTVDLAVSMTAGFSLRGGSVAWRSAGTYVCGQPLPCAGRPESGYSSQRQGAASVGIRLLGRGSVTFSVAGGAPKVSRDAAATLQGFDPRSGSTRWSFAAGRNIALLGEQGVPPRLSATTVALRTAAGRLVRLDFATGRVSPVAPGAPAWCRRTITYRLARSAYFGGKSGEYVGQDGVEPCTAAGRPAAVPAVPPSFLARIGASTGGATAWTTPAGDVVARLAS